MTEFKLRIRELRDERGMTQDDLSEASGVSTSLLSRYENNRIDRVSLEILAKVADALGVKIDEIIEDTAKKVADAA